jgi:GNAT superfamily N-acetyltransferase
VEQPEITSDMLPEDPVGLFYAWWRGDRLPDLEPPPELTVELDPPPAEIQRIVDLGTDEIEQRFIEGNRAVLARIEGEPAASGWSTSGRVTIGELGLDFSLPPGNRYLWDFVTLPGWRGRGIYPQLLQAFLYGEAGVERFWVGHDLENVASARGILKAGFLTVGEVYAVSGVGPVFAAGDSAAPERAGTAAELLGIPRLASKH